MAGRARDGRLFVCSSALVFVLDTAKDAFDIILQIGAGTGLLYLVRWFWWRVNAWCEVVAMVSSFVVSVAAARAARGTASAISTHAALLITIAVTTVCWVMTAYLGPATDRAMLVEFYGKVRPAGPGWAPIRPRRSAGEAAARRQHPARAARLGRRLHDDLVGALHRRQRPLRPPRAGVAFLFAVFVASAARAGERHAEGVELVGLKAQGSRQNLRARGRRVCLSPEP